MGPRMPALGGKRTFACAMQSARKGGLERTCTMRASISPRPFPLRASSSFHAGLAHGGGLLGLVLFVAAWVGILAALRFDDWSLLQSETVAYGLMALCGGLAMPIGLLFLVTAFFDWLGLNRPRRQRRQFPPFR